MNFAISFSSPGKSWNLSVGHGGKNDFFFWRLQNRKFCINDFALFENNCNISQKNPRKSQKFTFNIRYNIIRLDLILSMFLSI